MIDLHVHSTCSDGTLTPTALVAHARELHLEAFALTDHDTVNGLAEARAAAATPGFPIEIVTGIEFSTEYLGKDIHVVGLDLDESDPLLLAAIAGRQTERVNRNRRMIARMAADGIPISEDAMLAEFGDTIWTRAHFARYLAEHGIVPTMQDAFLTHIGDTCPYYIPRQKHSPAETVSLIRERGGIPVLAHPFQYRLGEEGLITLIRLLKESGLIGVEALYSTHTLEQERLVRQLCRRFDLRISGGSDYHGANKPQIELGCGLGGLKIPYEVLEGLREAVRG